MNVDRRQLGRWWVLFVTAWCAAGLASGPIHYFGCSAENLELEEGSPRESYCKGFRDFWSSGEPSEWTTPLPYLLPIAALMVLGGFGVWRGSKRFVWRAAVVALAGLVVYLLLPFFLPG